VASYKFQRFIRFFRRNDYGSIYAQIGQVKTATSHINTTLKALGRATLSPFVGKYPNRGESYHQFVGAVSYANGGKIIAKTENDQLIFKECSRLVCNVILYYNSHILSQFYLQKLKENNIVQINALKGVSPASWNNINLHGKYEFNKNSSNITFSSLNKLIKSQILVDDILDDQEQEMIEED
jgi:hypothetical protein